MSKRYIVVNEDGIDFWVFDTVTERRLRPTSGEFSYHSEEVALDHADRLNREAKGTADLVVERKSPAAVKAYAALRVITLTPAICNFLLTNDPKALKQVDEAATALLEAGLADNVQPLYPQERRKQ